MRSARVLVLFALLVMVVSACGGGDSADSGVETTGAAGGTAVEEDGGDVDTSRAALGGGDTDDAGEDVADAGVDVAQDGEGEGADDAAAPEIEPLPDPPPARTGDRIIKEGTVSIEVEKGEFDRAFHRVGVKAREFGGDVVASTTSTADNGDIFGSVTVRVPVRNFEDLLFGLGDIGAVQQRDVDSQDVSAEFTDLESRLRHLQAQERFYLGLFDRADSVQDAISVQQQLDGIQSQIEQIQGRLRMLDDRTTFSTLTVELFEPGAGGSLLQPDDPPTSERPSLAHYWDTARDAFVNVVGAILVVLLFAAPLLIMLGAVAALWLVVRRRTPASATRDRETDHEPEREKVATAPEERA